MVSVTECRFPSVFNIAIQFSSTLRIRLSVEMKSYYFNILTPGFLPVKEELLLVATLQLCLFFHTFLRRGRLA